jgi:hypothetical protein
MNDDVGDVGTNPTSSGDVSTHVRIGVEGKSITSSVRFAKIPIIRDDGPRPSIVTVEIDVGTTRRRARRLGQKTLCYTIRTNSEDPSCDERNTCGQESHVYDGKFKVDRTAVIRAIQCGSAEDGTFPSNVTSKTVTVSPPVVVTPPTGGNPDPNPSTASAQGPSASTSDNTESTDGDAINEDVSSSGCNRWGPWCWWVWILIAILLCLCWCCCYIGLWYRKMHQMEPLDAKNSMPYTGEPDADHVLPKGTYGIAVGGSGGSGGTVELTSNPMTQGHQASSSRSFKSDNRSAGVPTIALTDVEIPAPDSSSKEPEEYKNKRFPPPKHYTSFTRSKNKNKNKNKPDSWN